MQQNTYTIKLTQFEGPFDLLLFFIERDELNIYDIPISKITEDFLAYIREMEALNIDLASEFILVAATLMRIKAKMLIPRKEIDEEGNEIDPRDELVARLIEYKRYKGILEDMRGYEENRAKQFERGNISSEMKKLAERALIDAELESLTLFKLLKAFGGVLERMEDRKQKAVHKVYAYAYTIPNQQIYIFTKIREGHRTTFKEIFGNCENRMHAIITFLALLELLNMQRLKVTEGGDGAGVNVMVLEQPSHEDDVMTSGEGEYEEGEEQEGYDEEQDEENEYEAESEDQAEEEFEETEEYSTKEDAPINQSIITSNIAIAEPTADENIDYSIDEAIDVDAELQAIQALVENEENQNSIEVVENDNVVDLNELASDTTNPTNETAIPNQPSNLMNAALESMISSAIEVGATDVELPKNKVENFASEEE